MEPDERTTGRRERRPAEERATRSPFGYEDPRDVREERDPDGAGYSAGRPPSERGWDDPRWPRESERRRGYSRQFPDWHPDRPEWTWDRDFRRPAPYVGQGGHATYPEAAPRPHVGKGPKGYRRPDDEILADANQRLERDGRVDARQIEVSCQESVVTLRGKVEDRRARRAAEECVDEVRGVKDVVNELVVDPDAFRSTARQDSGRPSRWP